jgi:hypothetical protein
MNSNRNVLRPTHNRLPLQDVSSTKTLINTKSKLCTSASFQQQENRLRPILTATRSIKKFLKETNHDDSENQMFISPIQKANLMVIQKQTVLEQTKTREQLEQDLFEL